MINLYRESPLTFYYQYIAKVQPTNKVVTCYGDAGSVVHEVLNKYINDKNIDIDEIFDKYWYIKYKLDKNVGLNNQVMNYDDYKQAVRNGIEFLNSLGNDCKLISESKITIPFIDNSYMKVNVTGVIDLQIISDNEYKLLDWKTTMNDNDDNSEIKNQLLHYAYLVFKNYRRIPDEIIIKYLRSGKTISIKIDEKDIFAYQDYLRKLVDEIFEKGENIDNYEIGNIDSPFNIYCNLCYEEKMRREAKLITIPITLQGNYFYITKKLSNKLNKYLDDIFSFEEKDSYFIQKHSDWDGINHLYYINRQRLGIGFFERFQEIMKEYGKKYNKRIEFEITDKRNELNRYDNMFPDKINGIELRDYQLEAVEEFLKHKVGILQIGTGGGKTEIAIELIRRLGLKTLFITHKKELLNQTKKRIENGLGIKCGVIASGEINSDIVTIATIQSLNRYKERLSFYFQTVQFVIVDECHIIAARTFQKVLRCLSDTHYRLGISATAFRDDGRDMLIEEGAGRIIYDLNASKLAEKGYVLKPKVIFYHTSSSMIEGSTYSEDYDMNVVNNEERNELIYKIVDENKDKKILILTKQIEHGKKLQTNIEHVFHLYGGLSKSIREEGYKKFLDGDIKVMIATLSIASEGLDIPDLDIIINAGANYGDVKSIQIIGRVMRKIEGKKDAMYIDFLDNGKYCKKHSRARFNLFKKMGYEVSVYMDS